MNVPDITRLHINEVAQKLGFQRDTLEKVIRLYYVLKDISQTPVLNDNLVLKGGTAINLAYFDLPRLSVDIDMDFTKTGKMEDLVDLRKEIKDTLFYILQSQGYTIGKGGKELHTLDQWIFNYQSIGGNNDHIKIELNYGIRNHILPVVNRGINLSIVSDDGIKVSTLHPCELFATKINALIERSAVRDLFDVYSLSNSNILSTPEEMEMLRKAIVFYQTVGVEGTARKTIDISRIMNVQPSRIRSQLIPLLPSGKKFFPIDEAKEKTIQYLSTVLTLSLEEHEYLENFSKGIYKPELLFSDPTIIERISDHPMALWKIAQIEKDSSLSYDNEFIDAIMQNDYSRMITLKEQGYTPKLKTIEELEGKILPQTVITIKKVFELAIKTPELSNIQLTQSNAYIQDKDNGLEL
ncbi:nucleotidyl transferase AbiEii/AbiGii toxin family protein [Bacteroides ovatus]|uniref:nucleotidyl transferase AbiEii/AbiGii toxin family protein n=1 Tax=Bacteroides ovatus TaxID=28116 RepID=UPI00202E9A6D|nr:nucleotidyl transferase AbiEii/AbiGii toxin family protein [Bacteroides ovatus]MCM1722602.1 nucleotidyl transferase AbiEii/AbiGii toxin family protein [Bacteroides ovatus]MCM1758782.1 nucleotidyl transferase AbiEii/AbiGii toxin family protein [Bacteroides ovatus]MCM1869071.1 nucleotidyl transferase AbiEii/AbiGii toxin family protein [Bacteroides ovatus]MCM1912212.1 nucleotidyl transferase AbiEii/AbiGii toxin family protein [Bacteroides ovatus]